MCHLRNISMCDYQESVTTGQTHTHTEAGQSDPYVLCFAGDTKTVHIIHVIHGSKLAGETLKLRSLQMRLQSLEMSSNEKCNIQKN